MTRVDPRLNRLLFAHLDGVPLEMASAMLPWRSRLRLGLLLHLHLHARMEMREAARGLQPAAKKGGMVTLRGLRGILSSLESAVRKLEAPARKTPWSDYYSTCTYSDEATRNKRRFVDECLARIAPRVVWDLGANTGLFSETAREHAQVVVAMDQDPVCVDAMYRDWRSRALEILPLTVDLANPSPDLGWAHEERASLTRRGPADAALALALVHHLCIGNNVPWADLTGFLASVCRHLIVEFVPKQDSMVQLLLRSREDVFPHYSQEEFEKTFTNRFEIHRSEVCKESGRVIYHMEKRCSAD